VHLEAIGGMLTRMVKVVEARMTRRHLRRTNEREGTLPSARARASASPVRSRPSARARARASTSHAAPSP
jgi:hypothetical protein